MPGIRATPAKPVNRAGGLGTTPPVAQVPQSPAPPVQESGGVGPFMISSLPTQASGADVYFRQFYRGSRVPFRRYLPIVRQ